MTWVIRLVALAVELLGLYFVLRLAHQDNFKRALTRLAFDVVVLFVFVISHLLIEMLLRKNRRGGGRPWWQL